MNLSNRIFFVAGTALFALYCGVAQADGLADLKTALGRLQAQAPLKAVLEIKTWRSQGEGKDLDESHGQASVAIEDGARGLQVLYSKDILSRMESEERSKGKDPKTKTPTMSALRELDSVELRPMISATGKLSRVMEKAVFKGEKVENYNGKPARLLSFDLPIDKLSEQERKYVKKFEGSLDIWIAADGTPLGSRLLQNGSGRAFVVISFESRNDEECVYGLVGDRLLTLRMESKTSASGAGEKSEGKVIKTLQVQS